MRLRQIARNYPPVRMAMPVPEVGYPCITAPFATFHPSCPGFLVRLACLIHAANVRSEPGSNPSIIVCITLRLRSGLVNEEKFEVALRHDPKNSLVRNAEPRA